MLELTKLDWEMFKSNNIQVVKNSEIQILAAKKMIEFCDEKIKEFPEEVCIPSDNPVIV